MDWKDDRMLVNFMCFWSSSHVLHGFIWFPDVDECTEKLACQCPECKCQNTWGSYDCSCRNGLLYMHEHDTCIGIVEMPHFGHMIIIIIWRVIEVHTPLKNSLGSMGNTVTSWSVVKITVLVLAITGIAGYAVYKYRIRVLLFDCIFDVDTFLLRIEWGAWTPDIVTILLMLEKS